MQPLEIWNSPRQESDLELGILHLRVLLLLIALAQTLAEQGPPRLTQKIRDVTAVDSC